MVTYDILIDSFIERFKNNRLLPIIIHTVKCPSRKKTCRKRHGDIVLTRFDRTTGKFMVRFYATHKPELILETEQPPENIKTNIKKAIKKRLYDRKKLIRIMQQNIEFTNWLHLRITNDERIRLQNEATYAKLSISAYGRKKLFG